MTRQTPKTTVRSAVKAALGTSVAVPLLFAAVPAMAQSDAMIELRNQIESLEARLDVMESQQDADGNTIQLGDTSISVSGYVKLDAFYDFEADQGSSLLPADVLASGGLGGYADEDADLGFTARQTRLRISTTTPTAIGDVGGYIEMDMYGEGADAGGAPRLRQAYFTYGNWLFGRTWTTFSNFYYGTSLNFAGPAGQVFSRQEQIRYTVDLGNGNNFAIALEDDAGNGGVAGITLPDGTIGSADGSPDSFGADDGNSLPALAMRYQGSAGIVSYQAAGYVRQIDGENFAGEEDSAFGWGVNAGGALSLASGTTLKVSAAYGEGIGNLIYTPTFSPAAYFDGDDLETNERFGIIGTVAQQWTDQLSSNLIYGYSNGQFGPNDDEVTGTSLGVNLLYSPVDALVFGIEYWRVTAELDAAGPGGEVDGDANRVQFSTIYNF